MKNIARLLQQRRAVHQTGMLLILSLLVAGSAAPLLAQGSAACDHSPAALALRYNGQAEDALVVADLVHLSGAQYTGAFDGVLQPGDVFTVAGPAAQDEAAFAGTLGGEVLLYVDGLLLTRLGTDCLAPGLASGAFTVVAGFNRQGERLWGADAAEGSAAGDGPTAFRLAPNYPNPFNPTTELRFVLAEASHAALVVYDVQGREVVHLVEGWLPEGRHAVTWAADGLPSGTYLVRLTAGTHTEVQRAVLLK